MRKGWMLLTVAAVALLSAAVVVPDGPQQQDLAQQVAALQKQVKAQAAVISIHDKMIRDVVTGSAAANLWLATLPEKLDELQNGLDDSRAKGFTSAGPNPVARQALLDALGGFGKQLRVGLPKPPEKR